MKNITEVFGHQFYVRHRMLFAMAKKYNVALCGSTASAFCREDSSYRPPDIDFVSCDKSAMLGFLTGIQSFLLSKQTHYRIYVNSGNSFVPKSALSHTRLTTAYWLPICIFLIAPENFRFFFRRGIMVQRLQDVAKAADELTEVDHKQRHASILSETGQESVLDALGALECTDSTEAEPYNRPR